MFADSDTGVMVLSELTQLQPRLSGALAGFGLTVLMTSTTLVSAGFAKGRISAIKALQTPHHKAKGVRIDQRAMTALKAEALTARSATIDDVSGATYTWESYRAVGDRDVGHL